MAKFKIGDKLECIENSEKGIGGAGWQLGLVFTVVEVSGQYPPIYWGALKGAGVYETHVKLYEEKTQEVDNPEKLLVDSVILLKELRSRKKEEIEMIDSYLDRVAKFSQKTQEQDDADKSESESESKEEEVSADGTKPIKIRKQRKPRQESKLSISGGGTLIEDSTSESSEELPPESPIVSVDTAIENPSIGKIWCAVCNKYHTAGTHD